MKIYQVTAGTLYVGEKEVPLAHVVMDYKLDSVRNEYLISIRSASGNHSWLSSTPLSVITDFDDNDYADITAWLTWWNNLDKGAVSGGTSSTQSTLLVDSAGVEANTYYRVFSKTVTRPANTTAYIAGDVIGDVRAALDEFTNVAKANGYGVNIVNVRLQTNDTGLAGKEINVHFYNDSVTAIADNAAFAIVDADAAKRSGVVTLSFGSASLSKEALATLENLVICPVGLDIAFILETTGGFTPSANSTWIRVEIGVILSN